MKHESNPERHDGISRRRVALGLGTMALIIAVGACMTPRGPEIGGQNYEYPLHRDITATVFWVGEGADDSNDYIHNRASAWNEDWVSVYGGIDDPDRRCGYLPCDFTPKENPFYFALPFGDYTENGIKPSKELEVVPWHDGTVHEGESILKNRWLEISFGDKKAYAQWEDVGPFEEDDPDYVFGDAQPKEPRAGLDMSPGLADYLGIDGRGTVDWRFVDEEEVPEGPWRQTITRSGPNYN